MKTIGLIGGMSWESTLLYYRLINETVRQTLGGLHSAKLVLHSVDFADIEPLQRSGDWQQKGHHMAAAARSLEAAGADCLVLCTNTMHKVAHAVEAASPLPLLHIADATGLAVAQAGIHTVGLLGTRFTMEQNFYSDRLRALHGLKVLTPDEAGRAQVHRIIYEELCQGQVKPASRQIYQRVMAELVAQGAQAIVLGCTEITLLVGQGDASVSLFDTTALHARRDAVWAMND
jgi:aspartate racemase